MHLNCHPEYQLQTQFASYLIMIVTIILTLETGMRGECDIEWFNMMSIVMATGFVASDLEHMYMLACTVKTGGTGMNCIKIGFPGKQIRSKKKGLREVLFP